MAEEDTIFSSKIKSEGIFSFKDFYKFCYDWLMGETGIILFSEDKYAEKLTGDSKNIDIDWVGTKDLTDYFRFKIKVTFVIRNLVQVKIKKDGVETETNKGSVEVKVKGIIVKDYKNKFEMKAFKKVLRSYYEKYIIQATILEFKERIITDCDEFLAQAKSFLDLEGKKS
jgi:hypothetical protein